MGSPQTFSTEFGGKKLTVEVGKLAQQAHASCTVRYGDTVILATAVQSPKVRDGIDFFPLSVDYEERLYAAGRIKGSRFIKREGRASDDAILTARVIDRSIRPLFKETERRDVQVMITVLCVDQENAADIPALIGASIALNNSPIAWGGPVLPVRVGKLDEQFVINPTQEQRQKSPFDLYVAGTATEVVMIEMEGHQIDEKTTYEAIEFGQKHLKPLIDFVNDIKAKVGKTKNAEPEVSTDEAKIIMEVEPKIEKIINSNLNLIFGVNKDEYKANTDKLNELIMTECLSATEELSELRALKEKVVKHHFEKYLDLAVRLACIKDGKRVDGRQLDQVRELSAEVSLLPRTHGTGLFQRGETQVLSVVTLGSPGDEQTLDNMEEEGKKRYMHHYNFPGFSTGEVKPMRSPGRREIGHGALAEKALEYVLPEKEKFPYTIRVVSEVLGSNGSSSQASICGSTLALMDAGVPILAPVAGIAMGLMTHPDDPTRYKVLTDIQGIEDHSGDMDFKVAGTEKGITAIQLDIKLGGISLEVVKEAIEKAKTARLQILEVIKSAIPEPRKELSQYAPRIVSLKIDPSKIGMVIGKGGETINKIIDETGVQIDIDDSGLVMVTSTSAQGIDHAIKWIENITHEIKVGEIYEGKVVRLMDFGAFVELLPGQDGMVHISELAWSRTNHIEDAVKVGDILKVKVIGVDDQGKISLSHRELLDKPAGYADFAPAPRPGYRQHSGPRPGGDRGGHGGHGGRPARGRF